MNDYWSCLGKHSVKHLINIIEKSLELCFAAGNRNMILSNSSDKEICLQM